MLLTVELQYELKINPNPFLAFTMRALRSMNPDIVMARFLDIPLQEDMEEIVLPKNWDIAEESQEDATFVLAALDWLVEHIEVLMAQRGLSALQILFFEERKRHWEKKRHAFITAHFSNFS